ncbi:DUF1707 SHOCT-like domain-containing protein [Kutzneria kofuensis]|uniref:DUF1707 domain-containing protein n=1 Tax=Kutzneria kofuensis TaxID=103725 RepID=A0A7W9KS18_9PSEU|nr:DUF1707 domain-containing protein [Kutzneria kofuensis]MBB5897686.1 hypothetical protein [Kutzneria kofuensis]
MTTQMRASDQDREQVVDRLNAAVGKGLLTLPEAEERIAAAYAARYLDDLTPLTADLPDPKPTPPPQRDRRPRFDPRVLPVLAVLAAVIVVTHGFAFPLILVAFLAMKFGMWRHGRPARM